MRDVASNFDISAVMDGLISLIVCSVRLIDLDKSIVYWVKFNVWSIVIPRFFYAGGVFYVVVVYLNEWDDWYGFCGID